MQTNNESVLIVEVRSETDLIGNLKTSVIDKLKQQLTILNPEYEKMLNLGFSVRDIPRDFSYIKLEGNTWKMPRGFTNRLTDILGEERCIFRVDYKYTRILNPVDFTFHGKLKPVQKAASSAILNEYFSVAKLPTGAGKTVLALYCIAQRKQPTLVVVHTKELLYQWENEAKKFLKLNDSEIGLIGDGHKKIGNKLTVAIINSLREMTPEVSRKIGFLIVDECHHVPAQTFLDTVSNFDCRFMLGLSATPERTDGLTELIHLYLGDLVYEKGAKEAQEQGIIMQPNVYIRQTEFDYPNSDDYQQMISALTRDTNRNKMISDDATMLAIKATGPVLVVSDRKEHCNELSDIIRAYGVVDVGVLTGNTAKGKRKQIVKEVNAGNIDVLIATASLIGEGFNCKNLSGLLLTTPIRSKPKLEQIVGRIRRTDNGKEPPTVYDYLDKSGVLIRSYHSRLDAYREMGARLR